MANEDGKMLRCDDTSPNSQIFSELSRGLPFQPVEASRMNDSALLEGIEIQARIPLNY
jgi:hypothetical protein